MMAALYAQQQGDIGSIRRVRWDMQQSKRRSDPAISGEAFRPSSGEYRLVDSHELAQWLLKLDVAQH
jgi:hypothetical protein